ncbi:MAG: M20/M25/M40 family metallo-hydrolase [Vicinamibacterales bacterium]
MDTLAALAFARELIDIDSTTGQEAAAGRWLADRLRALDYEVAEQPVAAGRFNVFASIDPPDVVLSTHYDCVPPFFPSTVRNGKLFGRGACDAKGILAAQVASVERLRAAGERRVGLLFVVGEERGSEGATVANIAGPGARFLINGEPTDNQLATGTRGILRVRLHARGRAGHSSAPEHFESAIEKLIDALVQLRSLTLPVNRAFGTTSYSVGLIEGGVAPNVVPAHASAEVMFRIVDDPAGILEVLRALSPLVEIEEVLRVVPVHLHTVPGFAARSFPFTTDVPLLSRWGVPLLIGPGSFLLAHTDDEHLEIAELEAAIAIYGRLIAGLRR